jgi:dipeptidyl aminopeptidase/acylaminoacyl peptidase
MLKKLIVSGDRPGAESNKKPILYGTKMSMDKPNELFSIDPKTGVETTITNINAQAYSNIKLAKVEQRFIKASDGQNIQTWFVYPPDFDSTKKYPTLLYCQGGPQSALSQFYSFRWNFQLMAAQGYIVVAPNRRGMPGWGVKWNEEISKGKKGADDKHNRK